METFLKIDKNLNLTYFEFFGVKKVPKIWPGIMTYIHLKSTYDISVNQGS